MVISCPNCSTRYRIGDASIGDKGRMVRCASCKHRWFVDPPPPPPIAGVPQLEAIPSISTPIPATSAVPAPPRAPVSAWWLASVLVLLIVAALLVARERVVSLIPATAPLYATIGLPVAAALDLEVQNVASRQEDFEGASVLVVTGEVRNTSTGPREVPTLRVALLDEKGETLRTEDFQLEDSRLDAGALRPFEHRLQDVPATARSFSVTLADD